MPLYPKPNEIIVSEGVATMRATRRNGELVETIFDAEDVEKVKAIYYRWGAGYDDKLGQFYIVAPGRTKGDRKMVRLSRIIMDCPDGLVVDHINHNTLDNRKINLRVVPQEINLLNKSGAYKSSKTGVRGVYWHKVTGKWYAQVCRNSKRAYSKLFDTFEEACAAAEKARKEIFKEVKING